MSIHCTYNKSDTLHENNKDVVTEALDKWKVKPEYMFKERNYFKCYLFVLSQSVQNFF